MHQPSGIRPTRGRLSGQIVSRARLIGMAKLLRRSVPPGLTYEALKSHRTNPSSNARRVMHVPYTDTACAWGFVWPNCVTCAIDWDGQTTS